MYSVIIGYGEIGKAIEKLISQNRKKTAIIDTTLEINELSSYKSTSVDKRPTIETLHICIPYSEKFISIVEQYIFDFSPVLTIIHSTVPVGVTKTIYENSKKLIVHSPVRGIHPNLLQGLRTFTKYIGPTSEKAKQIAETYFTELGLKIKSLSKPETTELGKLLSTSYYGLCISWHKEMKKICDNFEVNFDEAVTHFNETYNKGYIMLEKPNVIRPTLYPPKNGISGHCIIENATLLFEHSPKFMKAIMSAGKEIQQEQKYSDKMWLFCEYHGKNKSKLEISRNENVSDTTINNYLKKYNIPNKPETDWTNEENNKLEELSQELSFKEISEKGLIQRTYESIRIQASKLKIKSPYDPGKRDLETRKKISCTLRNIDVNDFVSFSCAENEREQNRAKYSEWRLNVLKRDKWICQAKNCSFCNNKRNIRLHVHHIKPWKNFIDERYSVDNGITYCADYHIKGKIHKRK